MAGGIIHRILMNSDTWMYSFNVAPSCNKMARVQLFNSIGLLGYLLSLLDQESRPTEQV